MKYQYLRLCILGGLVASALSVLGCSGAGQAARDQGVRTIALVDDGIERDVRTGIDLIETNDTADTFDDAAANAIADQFFAATASRDRWQIATNGLGYWPTVRGYAEDGYDIRVNLGEIGLGVVESKVLRLDEFEELLHNVASGAEPSAD